MRVAVVGAGIAGLGAAWALSRRHDVTLYESEERLGGHARTIDLALGDRLVAVDTGFIVYNERNYPNLTALFDHHAVDTAPTDMSLSVTGEGFEFSPTLAALVSDPRGATSRRTASIIAGILRFRREAIPEGDIGIADHLANRYPESFLSDYLLPLTSAVWSASSADAAAIPAATLIRFLANHGLFERRRPRWRTVAGGSRQYVERLSKEITRVAAGAPVHGVVREDGSVVVHTAGGPERYDHVVLATHAPVSARLLVDAGAAERRILSAFRYSANLAVVHGDTSFMPRRRAAWASWNVVAGGDEDDRAVVTYWMNRLQGLDDRYPVLITINPPRHPRLAYEETWFNHPQFDAASARAQRLLPSIQGAGGVWYCGAWTGHGFHEDGLQSGLTVAAALGSPAPWHGRLTAVSPAAVHARPAEHRP